MARYYNADKLLEYVKRYTPHFDGETTMQCVERAILHAPTADVVEVVRCKDCTEWDKDECECSHWHGFRENDFCSFAERRDT